MTNFKSHSSFPLSASTTTAIFSILLLLSPSTLIAPSSSSSSFACAHQLEHDWTRRGFLWSRDSDSESRRTVPEAGFFNPLDAGGSFLTRIPVTYPMGQGEPLNAIVSGHSDAEVLVDSELDGGLRNYFLSLGFSGGCLGQAAGSNQAVDLGDGHGYKNQTEVMRWNYGDPELGSCRETIEGGNHFRFWTQDGPEGNSGAVFMAVSYELPLALQHDIIPNGYNLGRDWLIGNITRSEIPTRSLTNESTYSATTSFGGYTYFNDIKYVSGLLPNTSDGINHNITVRVDGMNVVDGLVAVLTVSITERPEKSGAIGERWLLGSRNNLIASLSLSIALPTLFLSLL